MALTGLKSLCSWRPHKGALAYSGTAFAYSVMHPIFSVYYVKVFLDVYKISQASFQTVQVIYMIWNAINDPLFGYCQDNCKLSFVRSRRHTIMYGAPFFSLSFLVLWFPWRDYEPNDWLCGVHLLFGLFFYDAMFTYVLLANGCLNAEMSQSYEDRIRMTWYGAVVVLIGSSSVFFCEIFSHHLYLFAQFQTFCVYMALLALIGMLYTGFNAVTVYDLRDEKQSQGKKASDRSTDASMWTLTWQILSNRNFFWFVTTNFMTDFHSTFSSNFLFIFMDVLVPKDLLPSFAWSTFYGVVTIMPRLFFIVMRPCMSSIGYFRIMKAMIVMKFTGGLVMLIIGVEHTFLFMLFVAVDSLVAHSTGSMFGLITSDIIDDDMRKYKRHHPMSSMVMGTNALVTKPAQSLAPMLTVYLLNLNGYEQYKAGTLSSLDDLQRTAFLLICIVPVVLGLGQYLCWSRYGIKDSHKVIKDSRTVDLDEML